MAVPHDQAHYETGADWAEAVGALLIPRLDIHRAVEPPPGDAIFAGFDVSLPGPDFHSAIVRPGLSDAQRHLELTSEGCLFTSLEEAEPVLEVANRRNPGGLPFCLVGVWCVPADSVPL